MTGPTTPNGPITAESRHPQVRVRRLEVRPVVGALALARVARRGTPVR